MEIRNLKAVDFETIYEAFSRAFADYAIRFEREEIARMLKRRGFNPELSFAAFHHDAIVAFTLNGIGMFNGIPTAYDTGTGTVKEFRGQGLAEKIFRHSIPFLQQAGINQYLLEVLKDNEKAISIYRKLGFKAKREFACFRSKKEEITDLSTRPLHSGTSILPADFESIAETATFGDFNPSWQNSIESILRAGDDLKCLGAYLSGQIVGYIVFDPATGDLTQIAVAPEHRRKGIASALLHDMMKHVKTDSIKVINVCSSSMTMPEFLSAAGVMPSSSQYEMTLTL